MFKLVGYRSNQDGGTGLGLLADVREFTATLPLDDIGSLTFSYPRQGRGVENLRNQFFECALVYNGAPGAATEVPNGRFLYAAQDDDGSESAGDIKFSFVGYAWPLNRGRVMGLGSLNDDGKREFSNATAGQIMKTLLDENKARGWHPGLTYTFTSSVDSNGQAWSTQLPRIEYDPTMDLFMVLDNLVKQGLCDWVMVGRELKLLKPDLSLAVDRSSSVVLRYGVDLLEGPNRIEATNLVHNALVIGEGGKTRSVDQVAGTPEPWGKYFDAIAQGGINDDGSMDAYAQRSLQSGKLPTAQLTRTLTLPVVSGLTPFSSYGVGDYITAPNASGTLEALRVREIGVRYSEGLHRIDLTLNDRIQEQEIRVSRRIVGIVGGTTKAGGSGAVPNTEDKRQPKAPAGLTLTSDAYIDNGRPMGRVQVDWDQVTQATDNTSQGIQSYEVWVRGTGPVFYQSASTQGADVSVILGPYFPNSLWRFKVRAQGVNGVYSAFTAEQAITVANDVTPPDPPSTPSLVSDFGVLRLTWDGKTSLGVGQPADWVDTQVHVSATNGFTPGPSTLRDTFRGAGTVIIGDVPLGETRYVRLVSRDWAGNVSTASAQVSAVQQAAELTVEVDGENISPGSIDFSKLRSGVYNLIPDPYFRSAEINAVRKNGSSVINFQTPNATYPHGHVELSGLVSCYLAATATPVAGDAPMDVTPGAHIFQLEVERLSGTGTWSVYIESLRGDGVVLATTLLAQGTATATVSQVWTAPAGAVKARLIVNHPAGSVTRLRKPLLVPRVFTDQIPDSIITAAKISANAITSDKIIAGAVVADKIAANAVTSAKIVANAITSDKILAGAVTAGALSATAIDGKTITGAWIQTAASGNRVIMNNLGIYQVDAAGTTVSSWTPSSFMFRSAPTGARVDISSGTGIRVFNASGQSTLFASVADGSLQVAGTFRTNPAGVFPRTEIANTSTPGDLFGVDFYTTSGLASYPSVKAVYTASGVTLSGRTISRHGLYCRSGSGTSVGTMYLDPDGDVGIITNGTGSGIRGFVASTASGGIAQIYGRPQMLNVTATAGGTNLVINGVDVMVSASLRQYKLDQEPIPLSYAILDLEALTFRDRHEVEQDPTTTRRYAGFIAEDVQALSAQHGGVFDSLLALDPEGRLQGLHYDRFVTQLLPIMRDINNRLSALEAQ